MKLNGLNGKTEKLLKVMGFLDIDVSNNEDGTINIIMDKIILQQAILNAGEDIQHIYGNTEEWRELCENMI